VKWSAEFDDVNVRPSKNSREKGLRIRDVTPFDFRGDAVTRMNTGATHNAQTYSFCVLLRTFCLLFAVFRGVTADSDPRITLVSWVFALFLREQAVRECGRIVIGKE
jgi:hypothetical protein